MNDLKPCPFCGNNYINVEPVTDNRTIDSCYLKCPQCCIETRIFATLDEAKQFWNHREETIND